MPTAHEAYDAPSLSYPTDIALDTWSFRDEFLVQPTTPHSHILRGDEFNGGTCGGNSSYASSKVSDKHEMRNWTIGNTTAGEFRQQEKVFSSTWANLPPNPKGTIQVVELKFSVTAVREWFVDGTGPVYNWGIGYDFIGANGVTSRMYDLLMNVQASYSTSVFRILRADVGVGNVFRGLTGRQYTAAGQISSTYADLRLQVVLRAMDDATNVGKTAVYADHWFSLDGGTTWLDCGQTTIENNITGSTATPRLHQFYIGSGWDQGINGTKYRVTREWDKFTYIWNPITGAYSAAEILG